MDRDRDQPAADVPLHRQWRAGDKSIRRLLEDNELWFILVANPDGYQYTFTDERLWRKNLRDNDGNGEITIGDGVDPNRNFPAHWKYDNEGSSSVFSSETYRGAGAGSEAETKAMKGLLDRIGFEFQVNWHSAGQWLLYAEGWQVGTATADDPIYFALSGNLDDPAIPEFHPGLSSDVLYVTNGETTDYAHAETGALAWTPGALRGLRRAAASCSRTTRRSCRRSSSATCRSRCRSPSRPRIPDDPETVTGHRDQAVLHPERRRVQGRHPGRELRVRLLLRRPAAGAGAGQAQPRRGRAQVPHQRRRGRTAPTTKEWRGGERTSPADVHYHELRGTVRGADPGDTVKVWFEGDEGAGRQVESFTYQQVSDTGRNGARRRGRGLHGRLAGADARAALPAATTSTRSAPTASRPTSTTSTPAAARRRTTSAS